MIAQPAAPGADVDKDRLDDCNKPNTHSLQRSVVIMQQPSDAVPTNTCTHRDRGAAEFELVAISRLCRTSSRSCLVVDGCWILHVRTRQVDIDSRLAVVLACWSMRAQESVRTATSVSRA